jgi:hypothetical protein
MTEGTFSAEIPMGSFDFATHGEPLLALSEAVEETGAAADDSDHLIRPSDTGRFELRKMRHL